MAINGIGGPFDYEELLDAALENRHPVEFFDLLWAARDDLDQDDLRDKWVEYVGGFARRMKFARITTSMKMRKTMTNPN